jgi:hypothetical protein
VTSEIQKQEMAMAATANTTPSTPSKQTGVQASVAAIITSMQY